MPFADSANRITVRLAVTFIRLYQRFISPFTAPSCRFYPSCSEYSLLAITRYGVVRGIGKTVLRLAKCQPFHPGGYDPLP
jgi:putative membrane protein insertion efficiency factor